MSADFVQVGPDGRRSEGLLVLQRPGRMLFRYKPPQKMEVVADGRSLAVRDQKLATQDLYLIGLTPLKFLLSDHIDLANDTKVKRVEMDGRAATIEIEDKATLGGKSDITLVFDPDTFELKQWTVIDPRASAPWFRSSRSISSPSRTRRGSISTIACSPMFNPIFNGRAERSRPLRVERPWTAGGCLTTWGSIAGPPPAGLFVEVRRPIGRRPRPRRLGRLALDRRPPSRAALEVDRADRRRLANRPSVAQPVQGLGALAAALRHELNHRPVAHVANPADFPGRLVEPFGAQFVRHPQRVRVGPALGVKRLGRQSSITAVLT